MRVKGTIDNVKNAGEDRVRVAFTINDTAINGNFNKLMTATDAKKDSFYPGDECEITLDIKPLGRPPVGKDVLPGP